MSLKFDSQKKIRKRRSKWKVDTAEEFEAREYQLLKDSIRDDVKTVIGQVRITAGKAKNILLDIPKRTRPLTDRMKTQIFDTLTRDIVGKSILDLYAGSGSFGLEALSRGARSVVFVDASKHAEKVLEANIIRTGFLTETSVIKEKVADYINKSIDEDIKFDLIFIDPPYKEYNKKKKQKIEMLILQSSKLLNGINTKKLFPGALIIKHPRNYPIDALDLENLKLLETNNYGMNSISIFVFNN